MRPRRYRLLHQRSITSRWNMADRFLQRCIRKQEWSLRSLCTIADKGDRLREFAKCVAPSRVPLVREWFPRVREGGRQQHDPDVPQHPQRHDDLKGVELQAVLVGSIRQLLPMPQRNAVFEVVDEKVRVPREQEGPASTAAEEQLGALVIHEVWALDTTLDRGERPAERKPADRVLDESDSPFLRTPVLTNEENVNRTHRSILACVAFSERRIRWESTVASP